MKTTADTQNPAQGPRRETRVVTEGFIKRYTSGPGQFALAIGACLLLLLAVFVLIPRADDPVVPKKIDYIWAAKEFARKAPYETYIPANLPASWTATGSRLTGTDAERRGGGDKPVSWHLALVTPAPAHRYAALEQSNEKADGPKGFVARMTNVPRSTPENASGRRTIDGVVWDEYYQRDKKQYSLVRRLPENTIVLTGTADHEDLATLASSLVPQPRQD